MRRELILALCLTHPLFGQGDTPVDDLAKHAENLGSKSATARTRAIRELVKAGEESIPHLRKILADSKRWPPTKPRMLCAALYPEASPIAPSQIFAKYRPAKPPFEFTSWVPEVPRMRRGRMFRTSRTFSARVLATMVLGGLREDRETCVQELLPHLADQDIEVRYAASFALGGMPEAGRALVAALDDEKTANGAAHALMLLGTRSSQTLTGIARQLPAADEITDGHRRILALIPSLPRPELFVARWVTLLGHGDKQVREIAHAALQRMGRHAMPRLRGALKRADGERTCRALTLFARNAAWTDADRTTIRTLAEQDAEPEVKKFATEALRIDSARTPSKTLAQIRPVLKELMRKCIAIDAPNGSPARRRGHVSVFDGSYDFHSCVIAHWSLFVIARLDKDAALEKELFTHLTPEILEKECKQLFSLPDTWITFPYDQGYYLMLLSEMAKREGPHREVIAKLRPQIEDRILRFLEKTKLPDGRPRRGQTERTFIGYYRSWLIGYLLVQMSRPIGEDSLARLAKLRETKIEPHRESINQHTNTISYDFLWPPAILAMIDRTRPDRGDEKLPPYSPGRLAPLPHSVPFRRVHEMGQELTRLWPLAYDGARGDEKAKRAWVDRVHEFVEHEEILAGSYMGIVHWIPQFMWIGFWFAEEGPK